MSDRQAGKGHFKHEEKHSQRHRGIRAWNIFRMVGEKLGLVQVWWVHGKKWQACDESREVGRDPKMKNFCRYIYFISFFLSQINFCFVEPLYCFIFYFIIRGQGAGPLIPVLLGLVLGPGTAPSLPLHPCSGAPGGPGRGPASGHTGADRCPPGPAPARLELWPLSRLLLQRPETWLLGSEMALSPHSPVHTLT